MSWWQKALSLDEQEGTRDERQQEEPLAKGGVREDLSELTQSFSRGAFGLVKGFGSFLAGEPTDGSSQEGREPLEDLDEVRVERRDEKETKAEPKDMLEKSKQHVEKPADAEQSTDQSPPKMKGLKADMSELTGTLSSSIGRFSRVIKVVTGEDLLPKEKVPLPSRGLSASSSESESTLRNESKTAPPYGAQKDLEVLTGSIASGFSKLASHLPDMLSLVSKRDEEGEEVDPESVGVTEGVIAFATSIASHPETWLDFPLSTDETAKDLALTELQEDHVYILEQDAPQIAAIRNELCPAFMSEERFWRVYFVLLASRLGTSQAAQLLTPDILAERKLLMEKLRQERGPLAEGAFEDGSKAEEAFLQPLELQGTDKAAPLQDEAEIRALSLQAEGAAEALQQASEKGQPISEGGPSDEDEVDEWLDDDDGTGGHDGGQKDPPGTEDSSFSDIDEEQEGASRDTVPVLKPRAAGECSDAQKGSGWVQLHRTASQGLKTVSSSSDFEHEEHSGDSPGSPAATSTSHQGSRTNSESGNEWLTVDTEDGRA